MAIAAGGFAPPAMTDDFTQIDINKLQLALKKDNIKIHISEIL